MRARVRAIISIGVIFRLGVGHQKILMKDRITARSCLSIDEDEVGVGRGF